MTLLITGGTGLVGQILVHYLMEKTAYAEKPHTIRLLFRKRNGNPHRRRFISWCEKKGMDLVYGDLRKDEDVMRFTKVSDPQSSVLIHSGAIFNLWQPFYLLYDVNVNGTKRILKAFHRNRISKLIHISSVAVYGTLTGTNGTGITEDQPLDLKMEKGYELTKALGEQLVQDYQQDHPEKRVTILRPSGIVGGTGTTLDVFSRMFFGRFVSLPRGGLDKISLVDVEDVARAIYYFSDFDKGNGEAFNLVSFVSTLREVVEKLGWALQRGKISIIPIPLFIFKPLYHLARGIRKIKPAEEKSLLLPILFNKLGKDIWIDNRKANSRGFHAKIDLHESMKKFSTFLAQNPWYVQQKYGVTL
ncbi:MAG: NAD(P)-dependent oxidoreductase [Candidatus Heimdallarchaeota archaeon]|nr:MAG: NAD(P)-dependent oxidoreductase [Candidatus Heimdallarchaeota archaeon]